MEAPPHLPVVTEEQVTAARGLLEKARVHRVEPQAVGWCSPIQAFTLGEYWFWFADDREVSALMPVAGMPYTQSQEAFDAYLNLTSNH